MDRSRARRATDLLHGLMLLGLCLCLLMQMLGAPTTMWNPGCSSDGLHAVLVEGLAIPPTVAPPCLPTSGAVLPDRSMERPVPLLDRSQFHPPDFPQTRDAFG